MKRMSAFRSANIGPGNPSNCKVVILAAINVKMEDLPFVKIVEGDVEVTIPTMP